MLRGIGSGAPVVGALADRLRQRIYLYVLRRRRAVTREEVAEAMGISRRLAAFHLDKLAARGLLQTHYARPPGRTGRGAGRTAKHYAPSGLEVHVSLPERRYDLAGGLLLRALRSRAPGERAEDAVERTALAAGVEAGRRVRAERGLGRVGPERALSTALEVLEDYGFQPYRPRPGEVALANCPFHSLAVEGPELVCRMNRAFLQGLLRGLGNDAVRASLECTPGDCCVTLRAPAEGGGGPEPH